MSPIALYLLSELTKIALAVTYSTYQQTDQKYTLHTSYTIPDENRGRNQHFAEGDIVIDKAPTNDFKYYRTWYNRTIPYDYHHSFLQKPEQRLQIESAMRIIENVSCVQFSRRVSEKDYITFSSYQESCHSSVGRQGGRQEVGLGDNCFSAIGVIFHEILHAMGLWHEQSRHDRDQYIEVVWDNIIRDHHKNFEKRAVSEEDQLFLTMPYDYGSVMHYANTTFANARALSNHEPCLVPKKEMPKGIYMGQREGLSDLDIAKINALYRCDIVNCSIPEEPSNGQMLGDSFSVGDSVRYSCETNFTLVGPHERVCRDDGSWSSDTPLCLATNDTALFHFCNLDDPTAGLCGWMQAKDEEKDWLRRQENTLSDGTGPYWDHTLSTVFGTYIYVEASNSRLGAKARLVSPNFNLHGVTPCFVFYTYMYGADMGNLTLFVTGEAGDHVASYHVFSLVGDQGRQWNQIFLQLDMITGPFKIILEASIGPGYTSDIAIDDMLISDCATLAPLAKSDRILESLQCSFDTDLCGFLQSSQDSFNWTRRQGHTPTFYTGPNCDPVHCERGYYLYIESSAPRRFGDRARIETQIIGGSGERCLRFKYHMYGSGTGSLAVKNIDITSHSSQAEQVLWQASGNQGNRWFQQEVSFTALDAYKIAFDATVGSSYRSDIAVDEIGISLGRCTVTVSIDCNFDHDLCGWTNLPIPGQSFILTWSRHSGQTDTPYTGPSSDRSSSDGHYVYVESSRTLPGDLARLQSVVLPGSQTSSTSSTSSKQTGKCLKFWHHQYGARSGNLTVTLTRTGHPTEVLLHSAGNQGNVWVAREVNLTSELITSDYRIIFEAALAGSTGDVAIDDISLQNSLCGS